jgi:hypothetical protein
MSVAQIGADLRSWSTIRAYILISLLKNGRSDAKPVEE